MSHSWTRSVNITLTRGDVIIMLTFMQIEHRELADVADTLMTKVHDLLESPDPKTRVRAVRHLASAVDTLERQVLLDAQSSGLSWTQIGEVYGISRQAAHRRFSDQTVVPPDYFVQLLEDLDEDREVNSALSRAASRVRRDAS